MQVCRNQSRCRARKCPGALQEKPVTQVLKVYRTAQEPSVQTSQAKRSGALCGLVAPQNSGDVFTVLARLLGLARARLDRTGDGGNSDFAIKL
jgi:hypothetical protein